MQLAENRLPLSSQICICMCLCMYMYMNAGDLAKWGGGREGFEIFVNVYSRWRVYLGASFKDYFFDVKNVCVVTYFLGHLFIFTFIF